MKYESEIIAEILEKRGHEKSSLHYQSECVETWIEETKGAYPKLCDYESEWLNYINENPIGEFPYETITDVTYATINNVVPYAYKSAILKGQTLVNLLNFNSITSNGSKEGDTITVSANGNTSAWLGTHIYLSRAIERGKKYIAMWNNLEYTHSHANGKMSVIQVLTTNTSTNRDLKLEQTGNDDKNYMIFSCNDDNGDLNKVKIAIQANTWATEEANNTTIVKGLKVLEYQDGMENWDMPYFEGMQSVTMPVLTTSNEDGTKTNILTVNEPIELRGIGEVKDELDCLNGQVTGRIGEIVLDGSHNIVIGSDNIESYETMEFFIEAVYKNGMLNHKQISDKLPYDYSNDDYEHFYVSDERVVVFVKKSKLATQDTNGFKKYLSQNPLTVQYQLATESIKTVDLTITNQDGETLTKLSPIEGTMHIQTDGTPIKPTISMEIPVEAITQNLTSFIEEE